MKRRRRPAGSDPGHSSEPAAPTHPSPAGSAPSGPADSASPGPADSAPTGSSSPEPAAIELPLEDHLDLHAFAPRDISQVVLAYLDEAAAAGFREVRLIHGKGIGWQRDRVRRLLADHPGVEWFGDAPAERGHWGATIVRLGAALPRPAAGEP